MFRDLAGKMTPRKGLACVFVAALCMSIGGLCIKVIPWHPMAINSFRSIISSSIIFGFAKLTGHKLKMTPGVAIGAFAMCVTTILYVSANKLTTAGNTILLQFSAPVFVIIFMWLCFHEKPKKLDIITCVIVFGGIACFFLDSLGNGSLLGDSLALLSGVGYAWIFMMNKIPGGDSIFSCALGQAMGAVVGLPWLVRETQFDGQTLFAAICLGVFALGIAYSLISWGTKYAPPVSCCLVTGIEPILSPILVALAIGEVLTPLSLLGGAIVFVTVMVYNVLGARAEAKEAAQAAE